MCWQDTFIWWSREKECLPWPLVCLPRCYKLYMGCTYKFTDFEAWSTCMLFPNPQRQFQLLLLLLNFINDIFVILWYFPVCELHFEIFSFSTGLTQKEAQNASVASGAFCVLTAGILLTTVCRPVLLHKTHSYWKSVQRCCELCRPWGVLWSPSGIRDSWPGRRDRVRGKAM